VTTIEPRQRPHFLAGPAKQLLIGGEWHPAALGATSITIDPATGQPVVEVADGSGEDVDKAVRAARKAFEGPWSRFTPAERMALILRFADIIESHADELSLIDTLDMGAPLARSRGGITAGLARLRWNAAQAVSIRGAAPQNSLPGQFLTYTRQGAGRGRRGDHPVEQPGRLGTVEARPGPGVGLHGGAQAG